MYCYLSLCIECIFGIKVDALDSEVNTKAWKQTLQIFKKSAINDYIIRMYFDFTDFKYSVILKKNGEGQSFFSNYHGISMYNSPWYKQIYPALTIKKLTKIFNVLYIYVYFPIFGQSTLLKIKICVPYRLYIY